ncbi:MAG: hypothetical protein ACRCR6_04615 [Plesiomonas sp.]
MKIIPLSPVRVGRPQGGRTSSVALERKPHQRSLDVTDNILPAPLIKPLPGRYLVHDFWAQLCAVQQQTTAVQMSIQGLLASKQVLLQLQRLVSSLHIDDLDIIQRNYKEQIQRLLKINALLKYQGAKLLTGGFQPKVLGYQDLRVFSISGLNLMARANRDEFIELFLLNERPLRSSMLIKADVSADEQMHQIMKAFAKLNIRCANNNHTNQLSFSVELEHWPTLQKNLYIRGGGCRIPTGDPIKLKPQAVKNWREISAWSLLEHSEAAPIIRKIKKLGLEIDTHLSVLQKMQGSWLQQVESLSNPLSDGDAHSLVTQIVEAIDTRGEKRFSAFNAIATQANLARSSVGAILDSFEW